MSVSGGHQQTLPALTGCLGQPPPGPRPQIPFNSFRTISPCSSDAPAVLGCSFSQPCLAQPWSHWSDPQAGTQLDFRPTSSPWLHLVITSPDSHPDLLLAFLAYRLQICPIITHFLDEMTQALDWNCLPPLGLSCSLASGGGTGTASLSSAQLAVVLLSAASSPALREQRALAPSWCEM